jgi:hypothetical protein
MAGRTDTRSDAEVEPGLRFKSVETGRASIACWERGSDSPYVETVMHGRTLDDDSPVRPAECHWHIVFVRKGDEARVVPTPIIIGDSDLAGTSHVGLLERSGC